MVLRAIGSIGRGANRAGSGSSRIKRKSTSRRRTASRRASSKNALVRRRRDAPEDQSDDEDMEIQEAYQSLEQVVEILSSTTPVIDGLKVGTPFASVEGNDSRGGFFSYDTGGSPSPEGYTIYDGQLSINDDRIKARIYIKSGHKFQHNARGQGISLVPVLSSLTTSIGSVKHVSLNVNSFLG